MKKLITFLLFAALCLLFSGCGEDKTDSDDEILGGDWRTTGIVRDSGSITLDGKVTEVLICVHTKNEVFYYDSADQTVFGFVEYPIAVTDPWQTYESTDFADRNGDGNSDVSVTFLTEDGDKTVMTWLWDGERDEYVYNAELSEISTDAEK